MLVFTFCLVALALTALFCMGNFIFWQAVLIFAGLFLAVNIVYILCAFSTSALVRDIEKPIEAEKPLCRFAAISVFGLVCSYVGAKVTLRGEEKLPKDENFLLVCNHRSAFDPVVIMRYLRAYKISCVAKPSVMNLPFIGRIAYGIGCLGIDRENDRNALKTILTAANYLKKGICNICIFPEGTRSRTGRMLPFQAGSYKIAQRAGRPLVIASINGSEAITKNVPLRRSKVELCILETIPADKVKAMGTQELAEYSMKLIAESVGEVLE